MVKGVGVQARLCANARNRAGAVRVACACVAELLAALIASAHAAQALPDPTRPPDTVLAPAASAATGAAPRLQSVIIGGERRAALIDGELVTVGGNVGTARVVRIAETEVVLRQGERTETLKLYPAVDRRLHATAVVGADRTTARSTGKPGDAK